MVLNSLLSLQCSDKLEMEVSEFYWPVTLQLPLLCVLAVFVRCTRNFPCGKQQRVEMQSLDFLCRCLLSVSQMFYVISWWVGQLNGFVHYSQKFLARNFQKKESGRVFSRYRCMYVVKGCCTSQWDIVPPRKKGFFFFFLFCLVLFTHAINPL